VLFLWSPNCESGSNVPGNLGSICCGKYRITLLFIHIWRSTHIAPRVYSTPSKTLRQLDNRSCLNASICQHSCCMLAKTCAASGLLHPSQVALWKCEAHPRQRWQHNDCSTVTIVQATLNKPASIPWTTETVPSGVCPAYLPLSTSQI